MARLFEYNNTNDTSEDEVWGTGWLAQTFTPQVSHTITSVKLLLWRQGSPGTLTVSVRATDVDGKPTGGDLASGTTNGNTLPAASPYEWREISLGAGYVLNAGTKYAIVIRITGGDAANEVYWRESTAQYANGTGYISVDSGSTWLDMELDCQFEEWASNIIFPTQAITRVTSLIHRYSRRARLYTLEALFGEVIADFGIPDWTSMPRSAAPSEPIEKVIEKVTKPADIDVIGTPVPPPPPSPAPQPKPPGTPGEPTGGAGTAPGQPIGRAEDTRAEMARLIRELARAQFSLEHTPYDSPYRRELVGKIATIKARLQGLGML